MFERYSVVIGCGFTCSDEGGRTDGNGGEDEEGGGGGLSTELGVDEDDGEVSWRLNRTCKK